MSYRWAIQSHIYSRTLFQQLSFSLLVSMQVWCHVPSKISFPRHCISVPIQFLCSIYNKNPWKILKNIHFLPFLFIKHTLIKCCPHQSTKTAFVKVTSVLYFAKFLGQFSVLTFLTCHSPWVATSSSLQDIFRLATGTQFSWNTFVVSSQHRWLFPYLSNLPKCWSVFSLSYL